MNHSWSELLYTAFFDGFSSTQFTVKTVVVCMAVTTLLGIYIYFVYRQVNRSAFYNRDFSLTLPALAIVTAAIILTIQSSIVISLGMVGALSIVRFRTAVKDPMDLLFLFWSISAGIICGAGLAMIAVVASVVVTIILVVGKHLPAAVTPEVLVVNADSFSCESGVMEIIKKYCQAYKVQARNVTKNSMKLAVEVRVKKQSELLDEILKLDGIRGASLVEHNGEVTAS